MQLPFMAPPPIGKAPKERACSQAAVSVAGCQERLGDLKFFFQKCVILIDSHLPEHQQSADREIDLPFLFTHEFAVILDRILVHL